ncbi:MAG: hypothetical protein ACFCGT_08230 [Sandaracinaceae bacterium]
MSALDAVSMNAREVLLEALMSVAWADRTLAEEERRAAQAAAMSLGLVLPGDRDLTSPDRRPLTPEALPVAGLGDRDRELIYLCAAWMALADNVEDPTEQSMLDRIGRRLALPPDRLAWLRERAAVLRQEQTPDATWWRAFDRLVVSAARAMATARGE